MRKGFFILFVLFITVSSYGQKYYASDILKKADSIMITTVGERIFKQYLHYDSSLFYEFETNFGDKKWSKLSGSKRTKGKFKSVSVRYLFCLNKYNIHCLGTSIQMDSLLHQKGIIQTDFIPEYVINNSECNFINDTTAIAIASPMFTKKGIEPITFRFYYDYNKKSYLWAVNNILTKIFSKSGEIYGRSQFVEIDALTGKVINFYPESIFGPVH